MTEEVAEAKETTAITVARAVSECTHGPTVPELAIYRELRKDVL
jgi:hypothetical protein